MGPENELPKPLREMLVTYWGELQKEHLGLCARDGGGILEMGPSDAGQSHSPLPMRHLSQKRPQTVLSERNAGGGRSDWYWTTISLNLPRRLSTGLSSMIATANSHFHREEQLEPVL